MGNIRFEGEGLAETGVDLTAGRAIVVVDPHYFRPAEVADAARRPTKAREKLVVSEHPLRGTRR